MTEESLIFQLENGKRSLESWQGFQVGDSEDFEREVRETSENEELMAFLAARRSSKKRVSLADVKKQLGLN